MEPWPATPDLLRRLYTTAEPIEATAWDLPSFFAAYTLHDSALVEVRLEQSDGLLVLIDWDMHWNKHVLPEYRNLVIGIPVIYAVQWSQGGWNQNTLSGATSSAFPRMNAGGCWRTAASSCARTKMRRTSCRRLSRTKDSRGRRSSQ